MDLSPRKQHYLAIATIGVVTVLAYLKVFHAGFMSWDDGAYVLNNPDVQNGLQGLSKWFTEFYVGNYHPLTIASFAIDWMLGGDQPLVYHVTSLVLHMANGVLVYALALRLLGNRNMSWIAALLFALNPVHTESVSWVAERKNVLYGFFFLIALWQYAKYLADDKKIRLGWALLAGIAAMLSKPAAITLPVTLFAIDVFLNKPLLAKRSLPIKGALLIVAVFFGVVGMKAQTAGEFLNLHPEFEWYHTLVYAGYGYVQYIVHFLVPGQLSVLYPYPAHIGAVHIIYSVLALAILALGVIAWRRKWWVLCGGIAFYTVNIGIVLQFVQFGEVLLADRYLYIPSIGILMPLVYYVFIWMKERWALIAGFVVAALMAVLTFVRIDIWQDEVTFWEAIVTSFPESAVAQTSVGGAYMEMGNYPVAIQHMDAAISIDPYNAKAWYNKGILLLRQNRLQPALDALTKAISLQEGYTKALFSRALLYQQMGRPAEALTDINQVLEAEPRNARAWFIKADGLEQQGNNAAALEGYNTAISYAPDEPMFYLRRGIVQAKLTQYNAAIADMDKALSLRSDYPDAYYWRGMIRYRAGQSPCADLQQALRMGFTEAQAAIVQFCNTQP